MNWREQLAELGKVGLAVGLLALAAWAASCWIKTMQAITDALSRGNI